MYYTVRSVARKSVGSFAQVVVREFSPLRRLCDGEGGVVVGELRSGARNSSSAVNKFRLKSSNVVGRVDEAKALPSSRLETRYYVSFAEEVLKHAQISARGEHSAAVLVVEDEKGYENSSTLQDFVEVAHKLADAARAIIMKHFRSGFQIIDKEDLSPVTIADRETEAIMCSIISQHFPHHAIFGEEGGLTMPEGGSSDYVWVLDPIDGTKSFITGKPVFGTLISLVYKGTPVLGIIDQPVLGERWLGIQGQVTTLNGREIRTRSSIAQLKDAYMYTTSPHMFAGETEEAFLRLRNKVKIPLYGCDCYAYGLLSAGHVDVIVEHGLKPYDYLALVPVVEGAGGSITNWSGERLRWLPEIGERSIGILAAGSGRLHSAALSHLVGEGNERNNTKHQNRHSS